MEIADSPNSELSFIVAQQLLSLQDTYHPSFDALALHVLTGLLCSWRLPVSRLLARCDTFARPHLFVAMRL